MQAQPSPRFSQAPQTLALALATLPERRTETPTPTDQLVHAQHLFWQHQRANVVLTESHASLAVPLPRRRRPLE